MLIATALTGWVYFISSTPNNTIINNKHNSRFIMFSIWLYAMINILLSENISGDMVRYIRDFENLQPYTLLQAIQINDHEPFFTAFIWLLSQVTSEPKIFMLSIWIIISLLLISAAKNMFKSYKLLIVIYTLFTYFLVFNFTTNIVRQGIAISILLLAVSILVTNSNKKKTFYISIVLAPLFHLSALPFSVVLLFLKRFNFKLGLLLTLWFFAMLTYVTGLNARIVGSFGSLIPYLLEYTTSARLSGYTGGVNRIDFLLFSAAFLVFGIIAYNYFNKDLVYKKLLTIYILFNTLFLLTGFVAYSDRVASFSWILIPLLVWYPVLNGKGNGIAKVRIPLVILVLSLFVLASYISGSLLF